MRACTEERAVIKRIGVYLITFRHSSATVAFKAANPIQGQLSSSVGPTSHQLRAPLFAGEAASSHFQFGTHQFQTKTCHRSQWNCKRQTLSVAFRLQQLLAVQWEGAGVITERNRGLHKSTRTSQEGSFSRRFTVTFLKQRKGLSPHTVLVTPQKWCLIAAWESNAERG